MHKYLCPILLLLLAAGCKKQDPRANSPDPNSWLLENPTASSRFTYYRAAKIARNSDGTFRAMVSSTSSDSIVFSFYGNKLPTSSGSYTSYPTVDSAHSLRVVVYAGGLPYQTKTPASVVQPITITVDNNKLHIDMPGQEAAGPGGERVYLQADIQEP